jgi:hypothetical protein
MLGESSQDDHHPILPLFIAYTKGILRYCHISFVLCNLFGYLRIQILVADFLQISAISKTETKWNNIKPTFLK